MMESASAGALAALLRDGCLKVRRPFFMTPMRWARRAGFPRPETSADSQPRAALIDSRREPTVASTAEGS